MRKLLKHYSLDVLLIATLFLLTPFFFYKLGQSSLVSWDEAWYAEIARNVIQSHDLFNLRWNDMAYYDHPPVGFWLIAITELGFGYSEFGVRAAAAIVGFLAIFVTYLLGKEMFNRVVGWCSAIGLTSAFWFLFRSRSGNLDVFLTFFFLTTFYTAWKLKDNRKWLIPFAVSTVLLVLTKTGIPFTIVPALVVILWGSKVRLRDYLGVLGLLGILGGMWLVSQYLTNHGFFQRYFQIGLPGVGEKSSYLDNFNLAKTYLHDGIGRWFWLGVAGLGGSLVVGGSQMYLSLTSPERRGDNRKWIYSGEKRWWIFPVFFVCFFGPFILTPKGHIWHLIPLHPFMILSFFGVTYFLGKGMLGWRGIRWIGGIRGYEEFLVAGLLVLFGSYIAFGQLRSEWVQFIDTSKYVSDEQILSSEAARMPGQFFIDDDFGPTAVWYSGKKVMQIRDDDVKRLFNKEGQFTQSGQFLLITKQFRLDSQGIAKDRYKILKSDRDKILVISD